MPSLLEHKIGYCFKTKNHLTRALTHASKSKNHLERQEFLGDAVLGLVIADYLCTAYPESAEGDLSKMRANLVCKQALLVIARNWSLAECLHVGDGERSHSGELKSESIAANAVESLIGAVFQDSGWDAARLMVLQAWDGLLKDVKPVNLRDAKSALQELTQSMSLGLPVYKVIDLGLQHAPRFEAQCYVKNQCLGVGRGERKKTAEINAAATTLTNDKLHHITG